MRHGARHGAAVTAQNPLQLAGDRRDTALPPRCGGALRAAHAALDDIQNPGNLGTIIRLADWFGIGDIVCSEATADCFNPKVVQATMGAILRVRIHYTDLAALLAQAPALRLPVYGTFLEGENLYGAELSPAGIVVMGNEGRGVGADVARTVTRKLFIPPWPADRRGSESLNVAMATGIVCAEFRRRCGKAGGVGNS